MLAVLSVALRCVFLYIPQSTIIKDSDVKIQIFKNWKKLVTGIPGYTTLSNSENSAPLPELIIVK